MVNPPPITASGPTKGHIAAYFCELCNKPLTQKAGRGRRKMRHKDCKSLEEALRVLERALDVYVESPHVDYRTTRDLRSRLWSAANTLNAIGDDRGR